MKSEPLNLTPEKAAEVANHCNEWTAEHISRQKLEAAVRYWSGEASRLASEVCLEKARGMMAVGDAVMRLAKLKTD